MTSTANFTNINKDIIKCIVSDRQCLEGLYSPLKHGIDYHMWILTEDGVLLPSAAEMEVRHDRNLLELRETLIGLKEIRIKDVKLINDIDISIKRLGLLGNIVVRKGLTSKKTNKHDLSSVSGSSPTGKNNHPQLRALYTNTSKLKHQNSSSWSVSPKDGHSNLQTQQTETNESVNSIKYAFKITVKEETQNSLHPPEIHQREAESRKTTENCGITECEKAEKSDLSVEFSNLKHMDLSNKEYRDNVAVLAKKVVCSDALSAVHVLQASPMAAEDKEAAEETTACLRDDDEGSIENVYLNQMQEIQYLSPIASQIQEGCQPERGQNSRKLSVVKLLDKDDILAEQFKDSRRCTEKITETIHSVKPSKVLTPANKYGLNKGKVSSCVSRSRFRFCRRKVEVPEYFLPHCIKKFATPSSVHEAIFLLSVTQEHVKKRYMRLHNDFKEHEFARVIEAAVLDFKMLINTLNWSRLSKTDHLLQYLLCATVETTMNEIKLNKTVKHILKKKCLNRKWLLWPLVEQQLNCLFIKLSKIIKS
ncbi:CASP8-associated protein 2-like isoform X2 [Protopterus annectens]|uniref:CASP8-associated protein 2-like isoform X2 n=1 Tax=Protopterus annectens TaxID=7888 RepID=UPI001CFA8C02|nr:CASP8-associated protein 2-like isoform X2 [Protopterus annectens]